MKNANVSNFFHDKPMFGLDIGYGTLKVMQLEHQATPSSHKNHRPKVVGYGFASFDRGALKDGVIVQPEIIAKATHELFDKHVVGNITTRRTGFSIPTYRTFTRSVQMPLLNKKQLREAIELEAEQYISMPLEDLYLDYEIIRKRAEDMDVFIVAVPKTIVDSYLNLAQIMGLETVVIEPTLSSSGRLFSLDKRSNIPSFIIDFGSLSSDISIFDKNVLVAGTVQGGGVNFTNDIKICINSTEEEARLIKTRYGLGVSLHQNEIRKALEPTLKKIVKEVQRMMRYYEEHYGSERPIGQIITGGGGANMPGLSDYLTNTLRLPVRYNDPWVYLDYEGLQPPPEADKPMYTTVGGLSLINPREMFLS